MKLGTTLYSLTPEFHARAFDALGLIEEVGRRGLGPGLEIVGFQTIKGFPEITPKFEHAFKTALDAQGLQPSCLGANVDLGRKIGLLMSEDEIVEYMEPQLRAAGKLGFPVVRMQFGATPEVIERLLPTAESVGVCMGMEIHAPHTVHHPVMLRLRELYERLDSPAVGFIPDFGASVTKHPPLLFAAFDREAVPPEAVTMMVELWGQDGDPFQRRLELIDRLREMNVTGQQRTLLVKGFGLFGRQRPEDWAEIGDRIVHVHGKFFDVDESGTEAAVPYGALIETLKGVGYSGFISSEWEGWHWIEGRSGFDAIARHQALLAKLFG